MNTEKIVAFLDIGTNSIRILITKIDSSRSWVTLTDQKMMVRLGEGEFDSHTITSHAMIRAEQVLLRYVHMAQSYGAQEIIAVATSALRDAVNQDTCIHRIKERTGIQIQIISGPEEARLIWLGVSRGFHLEKENALFIDIGGGSTEIIVGNQSQPVFLRSLKLGSIRTTQSFIQSNLQQSYSKKMITALISQIDLRIAHVARHLKNHSYSRAIGSSGTIIALESIARNYKETSASHIQGILNLDELDLIITFLCELSLDERKGVPGLNPERADIIIAGAIILQRIMFHAGVKEIEITERSLRDGLLEEYLEKNADHEHSSHLSIRERSVLLMGERFHVKRKHATHIRSLSLMLYDSGEKIGLYHLPGSARELLSYAAYLHDIGQIISYSGHHCHSSYLISSAGLLGFTQNELRIIALITRYHRKKGPRLKDKDFLNITKKSQEMVYILSLILRIAENLDRSHDCRVYSAQFTHISKDKIELSIECPYDCSLEQAAIMNDKKILKKTFSRDVILNIYQKPSFQQVKVGIQTLDIINKNPDLSVIENTM